MNVPKLRFKKYSEKWIKRRLGELVEFRKGKGIPKSNLSDEGSPCILYGELYTKYGVVIDEVGSKTEIIINNPIIGNKNDILIPASGETALDIATASSLKVNNILIGGDINLLTPSSRLDSKFISYQISGIRKCELAKYSEGTSVVHLYKDGIKDLEVNFPTKQEQSDIADFLYLIEKKINRQQEKVELIKKEKKGLMQKIFSQELRFENNDGKEFRKWELKYLSDIADVRDGTHDSPTYYPEGKPLITSKNLLKNGTIDLENVSLISEKDYKEINRRSKVDEGDILFAMIGTIGNPVLVKETGFAIKNIALIKVEDVHNLFLLYYLKTNAIDSQFHIALAGGTQKFIALGLIRKLKIKVPTMVEQFKIGELLNLFGNKVEKEEEILRLLYEEQKGFMQKMFV